MIALFKFASGFSTNALIQSIRCLGNLVSCLGSLLASSTRLIVALLQWSSGGKDQAKKTLLMSLAGMKHFMRSGLTGLIQGLAVVTFASPLMRATQACAESIKPMGILTPQGQGRTRLQRILGLNSWERAEDRAPERKIMVVPPAAKAEDAPQRSEATCKKPPRTAKKVERDSAEATWGSLVHQYLNAKTITDMDRIRKKMAAEHPRKYLRALAAAKDYGSRKRAA